jgi:hypothetical protein
MTPIVESLERLNDPLIGDEKGGEEEGPRGEEKEREKHPFSTSGQTKSHRKIGSRWQVS